MQIFELMTHSKKKKKNRFNNYGSCLGISFYVICLCPDTSKNDWLRKKNGLKKLKRRRRRRRRRSFTAKSQLTFEGGNKIVVSIESFSSSLNKQQIWTPFLSLSPNLLSSLFFCLKHCALGCTLNICVYTIQKTF